MIGFVCPSIDPHHCTGSKLSSSGTLLLVKAYLAHRPELKREQMAGNKRGRCFAWKVDVDVNVCKGRAVCIICKHELYTRSWKNFVMSCDCQSFSVVLLLPWGLYVLLFLLRILSLLFAFVAEGHQFCSCFDIITMMDIIGVAEEKNIQVCHLYNLFHLFIRSFPVKGRSFEEAAAILQTDLFEKQAKKLEDLGEEVPIHL